MHIQRHPQLSSPLPGLPPAIMPDPTYALRTHNSGIYDDLKTQGNNIEDD